MKYNVAKPTIKKDVYLPTDQITLQLNFPNEEYVANSWAISFDLFLQESTGVPIVPATDLYIDATIGGHAMIGLEKLSFETSGDVYTNKEYARVYKMKTVCNIGTDSQASESSELTQLKCSNDGITNLLMVKIQSVYLVPLSGLNSLSNNLRSDVTGMITVEFNVQELVRSVFGPDANTANVLQLSNIIGHYKSVPFSTKEPTPVYMGVMHTIQQKINTGSASISTNVPSNAVSSMSCSFLPVSSDGEYAYNQNYLAEPPDITRVQWSWNNTTVQYIEYPIETRQEMLQGFVESMGGNPNDIRSDSNFGLGVKFPSLLDLRNKTIGLQLESGITSADPYYIYMVFNTFIQI